MSHARIDDLRRAVGRVLRAGFFAAPGFGLRWRHEPDRSVAWELVGGHLLDEAQTRRRVAFESWEVQLSGGGDPVGQPLLAILWQPQTATCFVIRYLRVRGWEAYEAEAEPNVILSRRVEKLSRELVGSIRVAEAASVDGTNTDDASIAETNVGEQNVAELAARLQALVFQAFVGARLPVTSWESPLPAFQLGWAAYLPGVCRRATAADAKDTTAADDSLAADEPIAAVDSPAELLRQTLDREMPTLVRAKGLEMALRAAAPKDVPELAAVLSRAQATWGRHACLPDGPRGSQGSEGRQECLPHGAPASDLPSLFIALFHHVALTPYTQFADNLVALSMELATAVEDGPTTIADVIGYMLRHLVRHLTAFDLRTFHNRGANYPDALFLDRLLKAYLALIERHGQHFAEVSGDDASGDDARASAVQRRRRRALRQAWIVRRQYEGLRVPASPTSPGDMQRVLPEAYGGASEEEVFDPAKRHKQLFADDPLESHLTATARSALEQSAGDLVHEAELRELGMATFIDRPLGTSKRPGEVDRTPLLTYEAFSRSIARERLAALCRLGLLTKERRDAWTEQLLRSSRDSPSSAGHQGRLPARPGMPCLEDANLASPDFVFLRTTRTSLGEFLNCFDLEQLRREQPADYDWLSSGKDVLLIRVAEPTPASVAEFARIRADATHREPPEVWRLRLQGTLLHAIDRSGNVRGSLRLPDGVLGQTAFCEEGGRELPVVGLEWHSAASEGTAIALPARWSSLAQWWSSPAWLSSSASA